jgi:hypothetical protein
MDMLIDTLLYRQTATQFAVKDDKTSLRSSFVAFNYKQLIIKTHKKRSVSEVVYVFFSPVRT